MYIQKTSILNSQLTVEKTKYDAVVATAGGDYTTLGAAYTALGAGKSYFVKSGTYTEASTVTLGTGTVVHFDAVTINLSPGAYFYLNGNNTTLSGRLTLTGTGGDSPTNPNVTILFRTAGTNIDTSGLYLNLGPTWSAAAETTIAAQITSTYSVYGPIYVGAMSNDSGGNGTSGVIIFGADNTFASITIAGITDTSGSGSPTSNGVGLYNADRTIATLNVGAVVTTSGNNGVGVFINSDVTNSILNGVSLGSDSANLTNSGGATNKTANMTTS